MISGQAGIGYHRSVIRYKILTILYGRQKVVRNSIEACHIAYDVTWFRLLAKNISDAVYAVIELDGRNRQGRGIDDNFVCRADNIVAQIES